MTNDPNVSQTSTPPSTEISPNVPREIPLIEPSFPEVAASAAPSVVVSGSVGVAAPAKVETPAESAAAAPTITPVEIAGAPQTQSHPAFAPDTQAVATPVEAFRDAPTPGPVPIEIIPREQGVGVAWMLAALVMAAGIAVRLRMFRRNGPLYRDEAALAMNIIHRGIGQLFKPLDNNQGAPVGFLLLEKIAVMIRGDQQNVMRAVPLAMSILALPLFWLLARTFLRWRGSTIALTVLALGAKQYLYAAEIKQYSTDVCVAVALLLIASYTLGGLRRGAGPKRFGLIVLGAAGALGTWFSHPALFVMCGIAGMAAVGWLMASPKPKFSGVLWVAAAWAISVAINYLVCLRGLSHSNYMQTFWSKANAFAPIPKSLTAAIWYKKQFFEIFEDPASLGFVGLAALVCVLGIILLYRQRKDVLAMLIIPILVTLVASLAHKYPFRERLILFFAPLLALMIGAGFDYLLEAPRRLVGVLALLFLLITPVNTTAEYLKDPPTHNDMHAVMAFIAAHQAPGDVYYVYPLCMYQFNYYKDQFGLGSAVPVEAPQDVSDQEVYGRDLAAFAGKRVWLLFEDPTLHGGIDEQTSATLAADSLGKRILEASPKGEYVACYKMN
jgi:hypothetical protein